MYPRSSSHADIADTARATTGLADSPASGTRADPRGREMSRLEPSPGGVADRVDSLRFSANLGYLWTDRPLPEAIRAAHRAGFDAVEMHWPYATPADAIRRALDETGLPVLGINTARGDAEAGEMGLCALPGREEEARAAISAAIAYARSIGCGNVHVMAGRARGEAARETFVRNLAFAAEIATPADIGLLIEPLNVHDVPGYLLNDCAEAASIIDELGDLAPRLLFDCYHLGRMGRDVVGEFRAYRSIVGHVQFAAVPDRGEPDHGSLDFSRLLPRLVREGHLGWFGAEYRPRGRVEDGLSWLERFKAMDGL